MMTLYEEGEIGHEKCIDTSCLHWMYEKWVFFIAQTQHSDILWPVYSLSLQERELAQAELDGKSHLNSVM